MQRQRTMRARLTGNLQEDKLLKYTEFCQEYADHKLVFVRSEHLSSTTSYILDMNHTLEIQHNQILLVDFHTHSSSARALGQRVGIRLKLPGRDLLQTG